MERERATSESHSLNDFFLSNISRSTFGGIEHPPCSKQCTGLTTLLLLQSLHAVHD